MTTIGPMDATLNPLAVASQGVAKQGENFDAAVANLEHAVTAGQNVAAKATSDTTSSPTVASTLATVPVSGTADLTSPVVSLLTAKDAYLASLKALQVTADVQRQTIDALGHAEVQA